MIPSLACLNGRIEPAEDAKVPIWDRGFLFGDAVYEVWRLYAGRLWLEVEHFARLERSLRELQFEGVRLDRLRGRMAETIRESGIREGTVYVQITRGVAPRSHLFPNPPVEPTELIVVRPYDDAETARLRRTGVRAVSGRDLRWKRCDAKTTNLLANVLALEAAHRAGGHEAILVDDEGFVTEATHSSLLWVRRGTLQAMPEDNTILPGTTRAFAVKLAESIGLPFEQSRVTLSELIAADEVILSGTTIEIWPVREIDQSPVGPGEPGPWARRLCDAFTASVERWKAGD